MTRSVLVCLAVVALLTGLPAGATAAPQRSVVLDPGHGGTNPGAIGVASRRPEAQNVLAIGLYLREHLEAAGYRVVMTRTGNYLPRGHADQLEARVAIARASEADIFVSIHNNAYPQDPRVRGNMVFHRETCRRSIELAATLAAALREWTGQQDRGIHPAGFRVLRHNPLSAAVLVEIGFLTNAADDWLLGTDAYRRTVAAALAMGIQRYLEPSAEDRPASPGGTTGSGGTPAPVARPRSKSLPVPAKPEPRRIEAGGRTLVNARDITRARPGTAFSHEGRLLLVNGGEAIPVVLVDGEPYVLATDAAGLFRSGGAAVFPGQG